MSVMPISNITSDLASTSSVAKTADSQGSFSDVLNEALNNAKETEAQDQLGQLQLLAGDQDSIHTTMIESEKAELSLNLAIQVRNKVIDAYNEVMRMQL